MDTNQDTKRGNRKERVGVVVSDVQDKTIVVMVHRRAAHPLYKKVVSLKKKYTAHDENNTAKTGDTVRIAETRPMSKNKRWRLLEVISSPSNAEDAAGVPGAN